MSSNSKGTWWASQIAAHWRERGDDRADRLALNGAADIGDVGLTDPSIMIEAKNERAFGRNLAEYADQLDAQRRNLKARLDKRVEEAAARGQHLRYRAVIGWVTIKRPRKGTVFGAYNLIDSESLEILLREAGRLP